jgi:ribonucleoside-diphosphate reductase alpha chain
MLHEAATGQGAPANSLSTGSPAAFGSDAAAPSAPALTTYHAYQIIRRNGAVVSFEPSKIAVALMKAFLAVHGTSGAASASVRETVEQLTQNVVRALLRSRPSGGTFHIEDVQDQVELGLMRSGHHEVARAYVLYRERRAQERAAQGEATRAAEPQLMVVDRGERRPLELGALKSLIASACENLGADVKPDPVLAETMRNLYDGVAIDEVYKAAILAARTLIEKDPGYSRATARLLLHTIRREILGGEVLQGEMTQRYAEYFPTYIKRGIKAELLDEKLGQYDLARLGAALKAERDLQFDYLGLQTLYDRYFLHGSGARRDRPRSARDRVLRSVVQLRLHVQHADAVQRRHAPLAAVELLPDDRGRRPRRHLRGPEGERAAEQVRRRPGQRLDAGARARLAHQGHQR